MRTGGVPGVAQLWGKVSVEDDQPRNIKVDVTGGAPLLGMAMLDGYDLNIQVKSGGRVAIQPME